MAESLDVTARLAEGRPAVDTIGDYVWACHLLGYQNPDLTLHPAQVRDWYSSEDGLDLRALDADRAALDAAASATESARQLQEQQLGSLASVWQGSGGEASQQFLVRHADASSAAASAVREAADALAALRDDLWRTVDDKVATAVAIDDRRQAQRPEWMAATQTVTTGAGDRAVASELIDQQVKPFVDNDVRSDWLTAMQKAMAAVAAAFDAATAALSGDPSAAFEVPGDLGPALSPSAHFVPAVDASGTTPAAWPSPPPAAGPAPAPGPMTAAAPASPVSQEPVAPPMPAPSMAAPAPAGSALPAMPTMPSLGEMGGGLPGAAGGLGGLGSQLADAIGGLLDRPDDALPDPPELKDEPLPHNADTDPEEDGGPGLDENKDEVEDPESEDTAAQPDDTCVEEPVEEPPPEEPAPAPTPAPMPPPPAPIVEPPSLEVAGAETPCEIAADELPQAGP